MSSRQEKFRDIRAERSRGGRRANTRQSVPIEPLAFSIPQVSQVTSLSTRAAEELRAIHVLTSWITIPTRAEFSVKLGVAIQRLIARIKDKL